MGTQDYPYDVRKERELRLPAHVTLIASARQVELLNADPKAEQFAGVTLIALDAEAAVPEDAVAQASLLILEVDPASRASMQRIAAVRAKRPELPVIVALADASVALVRTLVRQGVADVVSLPFDVEELLNASVNAAVENERAHAPKVRLAPLIAVVRAVGGSGGTTIATHLANQLGGGHSGRGACLIDLDIQFGSVAGYLNLPHRRTLADLLEAADRIDADMLHSVAVKHHDGLSVIAAPEEIVPLETVDTDQLLKVIDMARREYDFVVLDMPSNWTSWNLSVVLGADVVLMVVELSIASLRQAKRRLELFASVGVNPKSIALVVNRMEKRLFRAIGLDDVQKALGHEVLAGVHAEGTTVSAAQDQGLFVNDVHGRCRFAADMDSLTNALRKQIEERTMD